MQVATPPTASEFRGGITGVTLRPVSGADIVSLVTDEHLLHSVSQTQNGFNNKGHWYNIYSILRAIGTIFTHFYILIHGEALMD